MAIKRKGVVAVPGEFKYGEVTEIKTAEELKLAAERQPIIMLTRGHPIDGIPSAKDVIGTVSQKWDEKTQRVLGEFWFHDDKIPENIRKKLEAYEPIAISGGILIDDVKDGVQEGIIYTHMAVLDGEDPKCPLGTCGINIRTESNPNQKVRFEQKTELVNPKEPEVAPAVKSEPDVVEEKTEIEIPKTEVSAVHKPEVEVKEPVKEEVKLVPEVVIPFGESVPKQWEELPDGSIRFALVKKTEKR